MKNQIINCLIGCVSILFLLSISSCSIEKRRYQEGYHVEWHHKKKQNLEGKSNESVDSNESAAQNEPELTPVESETFNSSDDPISSSDELTQAASDNELVVVEKKQLVFEKDTIIPGDEYYSQSENGQEINEAAKNSKVYGLLGIGSVIASILLSFAGTNSTLIFLSALGNSLFLAALVFAIIAVVLGKKAKRQMANLKDRYANEHDADLGLILGWIVVGLNILAVVLFILFLIFLILFFV